MTAPDGSVQAQVERLMQPLGKLPVWIAETPAMVVPRVVACLANEAAFAVGEGVADPQAVDTAMELGVNYPDGPIAWAKRLGFGKVVAVMDHLRSEYGEERYRVAPQLRRWARMRPDPLEQFTRW
jgi:3-hydroxybutyryl-CoA dehydrogenase